MSLGTGILGHWLRFVRVSSYECKFLTPYLREYIDSHVYIRNFKTYWDYKIQNWQDASRQRIKKKNIKFSHTKSTDQSLCQEKGSTAGV